MSKKVLLSYHSQYEDLANQISNGLSSRDIDVLLVSEDVPATLADREQAVQWCDVFITLASVKYQRSVSCMELLNYSRERRMKKPLVTIVGQPNYRPNGATGALSVCGPYVENHIVRDYQLICSVIQNQPSSSKGPKPDVSKSGNGADHLTGGSGVFISYHEDLNRGYVQWLLGSVRGSATLGDPKADNSSAIDKCKVFIALMSPGFQDSPKCQKEYDRARLGKKNIIPVKTSKDVRPSGWLALAIAGKLYHTLFDRESATKAFYDSNPLRDFTYAVGYMLDSQYTPEEREKLQIAAKQKQLADAQVKITQVGGSWPPKKRALEPQTKQVQICPEDLVVAKTETLPMNYIHHEVTRMSFKPPEPVLDPLGVPIIRKFDCMISYQWDIQTFVRDVYQDLHMRTLTVWMDIYGDMQGNINDAMSNGIESSKCILSFLTQKYLESANCNIELQYAIRRNKPIIFIEVEQGLQLPTWAQDKFNNSLCFQMRSIQDCGVMVDGIPRINRISEAIRRVVQLTIKEQRDEEMTEEVWNLHGQVEDALQAISELQGKVRFETCTRCGAQFDQITSDGCKKHGAYYMGGTIMAGRWVCCSQREKAGLGCEKTKHTTSARRWQEIQGGCHKWNPA
ncbi:uncharacterized protein LOC135488706 [Lineus longissimus]|uniref:uncharacterized protein LOC135488706 n=1 Tax=Lineus longissimus TaxID=88925 RepID=UPI00315D901F